jgi:hypothetical protein
MTTPRTRKSARSLRWFSAGPSSARSNIQLCVQIEKKPSSFDPPSRSLATRIVIAQHAGASRPRSRPAPAAIKSP